MKIDKSLAAGSTAMLLLKLLQGRDMYGYQMIEALAKRSDNSFDLKAGTLYPLLKTLEDKGYITSYQQNADNQRIRKYYHLTKSGEEQLAQKQREWKFFTDKVNQVMGGKLVEIYG